MRARVLAAAVAALVLSVTLSGCITVHGERVVVPATTKAEAAKVLKSFIEINNKANRTLDAKLNATIETGPLGAIDQAGLRARKKVHPEGHPNFQPLRVSDTRYLIPRQAGWPKFFVADTLVEQRDKRWLLVFARDSANARWKATYLAVLDEESMPRFSRDEDGFVEPVPLGEEAELALAPQRLSAAYARYLTDGKGDTFASGPYTDRLRENRERTRANAKVVNQYVDQPADKGAFAPLGLRTTDGGALVFFASYHHQQATAREGLKPPVKSEYARALMTGTPNHDITYTYVAQQAVTVPPAKGGGDGEVRFVSHHNGLTEVKAK